MKIAIATGIESFNNGISEKLKEQHQVEEVHFQEFLLENEYEIVILSKHLRGDLKITKLILDLHKQGKRVIFLTSEDEDDQENIQHCISYGIHDILYKDITPEKIEMIINNPKRITDISHLIIEKEEVAIGESGSSEKKPQETAHAKSNLLGKILKPKRTKKEVKLSEDKEIKKNVYEKKDEAENDEVNENNYLEGLEESDDPFDDTDNWDYKDNAEELSKEAEKQVSKLFHKKIKTNRQAQKEGTTNDSNNNQIEAIKKEETKKETIPSLNQEVKQAEGLSSTKEDEVVTELMEHNHDSEEDETSRLSVRIEKQSKELAELLKRGKEDETSYFKEIVKSNIGIIAITGTEKRVGVTHTALLLAFGAKKLGIKKVAIVEDNSVSKFSVIHKEFSGQENNKNFKLKGVDFFKKAESISNKIGEYDLVIIDMGEYRTSVSKALFKMAQRKVIVADSNFMNYESVIQFCKSEKENFQSYTYALPLTSIEEEKRFAKFFEVKKVIGIPYIRNPFNSKEAVEVVKNILGR